MANDDDIKIAILKSLRLCPDDELFAYIIENFSDEVGDDFDEIALLQHVAFK